MRFLGTISVTTRCHQGEQSVIYMRKLVGPLVSVHQFIMFFFLMPLDGKSYHLTGTLMQPQITKH